MMGFIQKAEPGGEGPTRPEAVGFICTDLNRLTGACLLEVAVATQLVFELKGYRYGPLCSNEFPLQVSDDSHIMFMNTIHNNYSDIITRSYINITFVCRYPLSYMVQQPGGQNLIRVDVR